MCGQRFLRNTFRSQQPQEVLGNGERHERLDNLFVLTAAQQAIVTQD